MAWFCNVTFLIVFHACHKSQVQIIFVQANTDVELPEYLLGTCRLNHLDASKAVPLKSWSGSWNWILDNEDGMSRSLCLAINFTKIILWSLIELTTGFNPLFLFIGVDGAAPVELIAAPCNDAISYHVRAHSLIVACFSPFKKKERKVFFSLSVYPLIFLWDSFIVFIFWVQ